MKTHKLFNPFKLLHEIHKVELRHKRTPIASLETELLSLRRQTVDLLHYRAKAVLQFCQKLTCESGNKYGKLLAKAVRNHRLNTYVPQIITPLDQKRVMPTQIVKEFGDYYSSLYNLLGRSSNEAAKEDYIASSQLTAEVGVELDVPITLEELQKAVGGMKPGKAPCPDGFTLQYYQSLLPLLGPYGEAVQHPQRGCAFS